MAELKTKKTGASVTAYLNAITDKQKRADCREIAKMMRDATGNRARMWGSSIVGYGCYDYKYASGREGTWPICGFSPRAQNISIYIMPGFSKFGKMMKSLGKYKTGKSCLYVKKLEDVDRKVLKDLIPSSVKEMRRKYGLQETVMTTQQNGNNRRNFLKYLAASPLCNALAGLPFAHASGEAGERITSPDQAIDIFDLKATAKELLPPAHYGYMATGTNDDKTLRANREAFAHSSPKILILVSICLTFTSRVERR